MTTVSVSVSVSVSAVGYLLPTGPVHGRVRLVTRRGWWLETDDGVCLVVHGRSGGRTPTSVVVPDAILEGCGPEPGAPFCLAGSTLVVAGTHLDLRDACRWQPDPALPTVEGASQQALVVLCVAAGPALEQARERLGPEWQAVVPAAEYCVTEDTPGWRCALERAVAGVVGLGPGLTPSGDDALVGFLAGLRYGAVRCAPAFLELGHAVTACLLHTTFVSAHKLRLAADGHFDEAVIAVVTTVMAPTLDSCQLAGAVDDLLRVGATSGADLLVGVFDGLRLPTLLAASRAA